MAEGKTIYCLGPFYRRGTQRSQAVYAHGRPNGVAWLVGWLVLFGFGHVVHGWFLEMFRGPFGRRAPGAFVMKRAQLPPGASSSGFRPCLIQTGPKYSLTCLTCHPSWPPPPSPLQIPNRLFGLRGPRASDGLRPVLLHETRGRRSIYYCMSISGSERACILLGAVAVHADKTAPSSIRARSSQSCPWY